MQPHKQPYSQTNKPLPLFLFCQPQLKTGTGQEAMTGRD